MIMYLSLQMNWVRCVTAKPPGERGVGVLEECKGTVPRMGSQHNFNPDCKHFLL